MKEKGMIYMILQTIDYQVIVDSLAVIMTYSAPVFIIFEIASRLLSLFLDFVGGKKRVTL